MKIENFAFLLLPQAHKSDLLDIITSLSKLYNGGTIMFWKFADLQFNKKFNEFSIYELKRIAYVNQVRTVKKYFLTDQTMKRIEERIKEKEKVGHNN